jgi:hypothetical protein
LRVAYAANEERFSIHRFGGSSKANPLVPFGLMLGRVAMNDASGAFRTRRTKIDDKVPRLLPLLTKSNPHLAGHPTSLADDLERVGDETVAPQRLQLALPHARQFTRDAHF